MSKIKTYELFENATMNVVKTVTMSWDNVELELAKLVGVSARKVTKVPPIPNTAPIKGDIPELPGSYSMPFIYTDGSYFEGVATWAFVVVQNKKIIDSGAGVCKAASMNNISGELRAAVEAVKWAIKHDITIVLLHDYLGIGKWATDDWKAKKEATRRYKEWMMEHREFVAEFRHVKGHSGNEYNELADQLAYNALQLELNKEIK